MAVAVTVPAVSAASTRANMAISESEGQADTVSKTWPACYRDAGSATSCSTANVWDSSSAALGAE